jgi:hypothetical protein
MRRKSLAGVPATVATEKGRSNVGSAEEKRSHSEGVEQTGAQSSDQEPRRGSLPGALAGAAGAAAAGGGAGALARDQLRAARQSDRSGGGDDSGTSDQPAE